MKRKTPRFLGRKIVFWLPFLGLILLFLLWLFLPSAELAMDLDEYYDMPISSIVLTPRPGSQEKEIVITSDDEILEIQSWFKNTKVRPTFYFRGGGCQVSVHMHLENGERFNIRITEDDGLYIISGPHNEHLVSVIPFVGRGFWTEQLEKFS